METLIAYHGNASEKRAILAQLRAHAAADELVQGTGWRDGKGCAVGCTLHAYEHALYEQRFGIPEPLAQLEDTIFEGLPNDEAQKWPVAFMSAIPVGADLSLVQYKFLHWLLTDETINPGINHPLLKDAVSQCAEITARRARGEAVSADEVRSAKSAARSASIRAERSIAWSASDAAWSIAWSAAQSVVQNDAWSIAWSAAQSVVQNDARSTARSTAYSKMAAKLLSLLRETA